MKESRLQRINEEVREVLSQIIQRDLNDPRLDGAFITILKVDVDNELDFATTYVSIYNVQDKQATFNILQSCAGYIRKLLAQKISLRKVPVIRFVLDKNEEYSERINKVLASLEIPKDDEENGAN